MRKTKSYNDIADEIRIYSEAEAADFLSMSKRTLQNMRQAGGGPAYVKISTRRVGYSLASLKTWVASRSVCSTAQATVRFGGAA